MNAKQAAQAIVALINSSPRSPRQDEIEAIIGGHIGGAPAVGAITAHRPEWSRLFADWYAKCNVSGKVAPGAPEEKEAMAQTSAAYDLLRTFERELCARPATSWADVGMLGDILFRTLYECVPDGLCGARSDAVLERGPVVAGDEIDEIIASLLRAIRDVTMGAVRHG